MARQGGPRDPLGAATEALAGLSYIFVPIVVSIIAIFVDGNKLARFLTFQNQQKKHMTKLETPH
jgi:hypothetical protein